jgi:hypothetical protein
MMDPMGDIGAGEDEAPAMDSNMLHLNLKSNEIVDPYIVQFNLARIERIRSVMGILSGSIAGIVGFTGIEGFGTLQIQGSVRLMMSHAISFALEWNMYAYNVQMSSVSYVRRFSLLNAFITFSFVKFALLR